MTADARGHGGSIFAPPWDALDDAALLRHFRGPRAVRYYPVADAEETRPEKIEALMQGDFVFNGESHRLADPVDWLHNPSRDIEWHILLHKFYYAVGLGLAFQRTGDTRYVRRWAALIDGWIGQTPAGFIAADVTGRRVQNWIYSLHLIVGHPAHEPGDALDAAFHRRLLVSLHEQVDYLCSHLTPKRNHRTLELYAIFLAGVVFPEMRDAPLWREFALEQTVANLQDDLLPDGVHCELSTDYHHLVLKNALHFRQLAALNGVSVSPGFDAQLERGLEFSLHVHRPDGIVPAFSDGDARSYLELLRQGAALFHRPDMLYVATQGREGEPPRQRVAHFEHGGYHVLRSHWGEDGRDFTSAQHLVFDCGPVGEGNHGHFDGLSVELFAHGRPLLVDPGRYTYSEAVDPADGINWRVYFRGTAAHNTVCVDDSQQTRYEPRPIKPGTRHAAGSVRHRIAGPAPDARLVARAQLQGLDLLHGQLRSHAYDAVHERCIVCIDGRYWIVSDWLRAPTPHRYRLNFQLAPQAEDHVALDRKADVWQVRSPGLLMLQPASPGDEVRLDAGWVSPAYGFKSPAPRLQTVASGCAADFDTLLFPWDAAPPDVSVDVVPVQAEGPVDAGAGVVPAPRALRVRQVVDGELQIDHWFHARGGEAAAWLIGGQRITGPWAHWRTDEHGRVLRLLQAPAAERRPGGSGS